MEMQKIERAADPAAEYYAGAKRVTVDGAPQRVFQWRSRELSAQIASIEIACAAGCPVELGEAPLFSFVPAERDEGEAIQHKVSAPAPKTSPMMKEYYKGGTRVTIGGVPCRLARPLAKNHSTAHWAKLGAPMLDWEKRAAAWWKGVQDAKGEESEPAPIPVHPEPTVEIEDEAPIVRIEEPAAPDPVIEYDAPTYLVRTITAEGRVDRPFASMVEAVEEVGQMYLRREWAAIHAVGIVNPFCIHPHGARHAVKSDEKPWRWGMSFESDTAYKSAACFTAERCGVRYASHRRGYQASNRAVRRFAVEWDALVVRLTQREAAQEPAEREAEAATPATLPDAPEIALSEAVAGENGQSEPACDPLADVTARMDALEALLATLSAESVETPIGAIEPRAKRTPAHERAVRRAWRERGDRRTAERVMAVAAKNQAASNGEIIRLRTELAGTEQTAAERLQAIAHESERRVENARRARRMLAAERAKSARLNVKRRANALLARQRTNEMVAAVNYMHDQADGLRAETEAAKRAPTYFDADTGMEKFDQVNLQGHFAKLAQERAERAETALSAMVARCTRAEEARDKLADAVEGMASRLAVAEATVRRIASAA